MGGWGFSGNAADQCAWGGATTVIVEADEGVGNKSGVEWPHGGEFTGGFLTHHVVGFAVGEVVGSLHFHEICHDLSISSSVSGFSSIKFSFAREFGVSIFAGLSTCSLRSTVSTLTGGGTLREAESNKGDDKNEGFHLV